MFKMDAQGRLAFPPELKVYANDVRVCKFKLIANRFEKGQSVAETATFFCFGEEAERFCETVEVGQFVSATGVQETYHYVDRNTQKPGFFVEYRLTWFQAGPKPVAKRTDNPYDRRPSENGGYSPQGRPTGGTQERHSGYHAP